ncbi:hypothetical protein HNQ94_003100 [Salirhabdus euzebyi]|uniref:Uncharacterized protein n=1 Tax=Salirhabdus euzebyi TaxID=394506 RepID=A0A841Q833_9BACI|nr:hypothetical protein [Salirhabdus euzebyi]MBB6454611.1 hypothetical protein [Salirhabdus euzebyi]
MPIDEIARKKWLAIPESERKTLEESVFCSECYVTTIVDYHVESIDFNIVLKGKCKKCGKDVARMID